MTRISKTLFLMMLIGAFIAGGMGLAEGETGGKPAASSGPQAKAKTESAPGELLVKFKGMDPPSDPSKSGTLNEEQLFLASLPDAAMHGLREIQGEIEKSYTAVGWVKVRFPKQMSVDSAIDILQRTGTVEYVEPNYRVRASGLQGDVVPPETPSRPILGATPTDPRFKEQWALNNTGQTGGQADADIDAVEAWNTQKSALGVVTVVIGTGIDYKHQDLLANMWHNPKETPNNGVDDDKNGYIDDYYGIDAYLNSGNPMDDHGSGTHIAGIIGAAANNGKGIAGVAWQAQLMALKFLDDDGWGWVADAVQCMDYALKIKQANSYPRMVIQIASLLGEPYSRALYDSIVKAGTAGVLVVTGSGDADRDVDIWPIYPGGFELPNIINVTASNHTDTRWNGQSGARNVDLYAPGTDILSTWLTNTYALKTGTDLAAAHVTGSCGLLWTKNPAMTWKQIKGLVLNGAENGLHGEWFSNYCVSEGRLNVNNSLNAALNADPAIFTITPTETNVKETVSIKGIGFGTVKGTVKFGDFAFPAASILSWANEEIKTKIPDNCPTGHALLKVTTTAGTSRGALLRLGEWVDPTYQGETILQHEEAAYAQVGNDIWIISGNSNYGQTEMVERFSLITLRGEIKPEWAIPKPVRRAGAAAIGSKIYVVGGYDDLTRKIQKNLQIFDTATGTWTRGRNVPQYLEMPTVVSSGNKLYVFGGKDPNNTGLKTAYMFDPANNTWTAKANLPVKRAYAPAAMPVTGKIWLMSGYTESGGSWYRTKDVLEYDLATNSWSFFDFPLLGEHAAGFGISIGSKPFCFYGDGDWVAGEYFSFGSWKRCLSHISGTGTYTVMGGRLGNTIYLLSGSRGRQVMKLIIP